MPSIGSDNQFEALFRHGIEKGLTPLTAFVYALLAWNYEIISGEFAPRIVSGRRSFEHQLSLRKRWEQGDRRGLVVRPALSSSHTRGTGFDLQRGPALPILGSWIEQLGGRWGGNFRDRDPVHFDFENTDPFSTT